MTSQKKTIAMDQSDSFYGRIMEILSQKNGEYNELSISLSMYTLATLNVCCKKGTPPRDKEYCFHLEAGVVTSGNGFFNRRFTPDILRPFVKREIDKILGHSSTYQSGQSAIDFVRKAMHKIAVLFSNIPDRASEDYPNLKLIPIFRRPISLPLHDIGNVVEGILKPKPEQSNHSQFSIEKKVANHRNNDRAFFKKFNQSTSLGVVIDGEGSSYLLKNAEFIMAKLIELFESVNFESDLDQLQSTTIDSFREKIESVINENKIESGGMVTFSLIIAKNNWVYSFYLGDTHSFLYNGHDTIWLTPDEGACINVEKIPLKVQHKPHYTFDSNGIPPNKKSSWKLNALSLELPTDTSSTDFTIIIGSDGVFDLFLHLVGRDQRQTIQKSTGEETHPSLLFYDFNLISSYLKIANGDPEITKELFEYHISRLAPGKPDDQTLVCFTGKVENISTCKSALSVMDLF